jgi:hypothetical protein
MGRMIRFLVVVAVAALVPFVSGCGGSSGHASEYPAGAQTDFVTLCAAQPNASAQGCGCLYDELSKRIPYQRFATEGPVIASGGEISGPDFGAVGDAINTCAAKIQTSAGG